jgi:aminopeptidase N
VRSWHESEIRRARRYVRLGYFLCALCALCGAYGLGSQEGHAQAPAVEPLRTAADRSFDIQHIRLDLRVDLPKKAAQGRATIKLRSLRSINAIALDAVEFEVSKVMMMAGDQKQESVRFSHDGRKLVLDLEPAWPAGKEATLRIDYRVREPKAGLHFFGPTEAEPDVPLTVWSQGEPDTNRYWFPCVDQPNQRQTTELVVTVADGFEVLSNGKLIERQSNPDKSVTFHWRQDKPHAAYLVTLVVGRFDIVREEWNELPVLFYVPKGHKEEIARTFGRTREMLTFFSKRFGIDYPWDKYAQVVVEQFSAGGMENTSATTLTDRALHDQRSTLDSSAEGLLAHELAHQWWGDMVTCRDWSHLWLNEGFASYAEVLWAEHAKGPDEAAYQLIQKARAAIAGGKERPIVDRRYPSSWSMFDARSYPKGAWVLHMLRQRLGEEMFWKCIQQYGTEHRFQSADTTDFRKTLERVTGRSLERFFYDRTERSGHPVLQVGTDYLPDSKQLRIVVKQIQASEPFHFPLKISINRHLGRSSGSAARVREIERDITEKEQSFYFDMDRPELVEIDPEQAVLAEIKETKSRELWLKQLTHSPSVSARVRAAEHFGQSKAPADREALAAALNLERFWGVQAEVAVALGESGGDSCREALIQGLHHAHPRVRRACADQLGKFHHDAKAAAALKAVLQEGDPSYFVEAACLGAYAKLQQPDTVAVLLPWLAKPSHNDVLRAAALEGLGNSQDLSALDTLTTWTKRGKPRTCRAAALLGLARLAQKANPSDEQRQRVVTVVAACLDSESAPIRRSAVTALRELGRSAAPTLDTLDAIARHDPDERLRELARKAAEQIRSNTPVTVELTRLREELERVKRANEALRERVDKFEKIERK